MNSYTLFRDGISFKQFEGTSEIDTETGVCDILAPLWLEEHLRENDIIGGPDSTGYIILFWEKGRVGSFDVLRIHCA